MAGCEPPVLQPRNGVLMYQNYDFRDIGTVTLHLEYTDRTMEMQLLLVWLIVLQVAKTYP